MTSELRNDIGSLGLLIEELRSSFDDADWMTRDDAKFRIDLLERCSAELYRWANAREKLVELGAAVLDGGPPDDIGPTAEQAERYYAASDAVKKMACELAKVGDA